MPNKFKLRNKNQVVEAQKFEFSCKIESSSKAHKLDFIQSTALKSNIKAQSVYSYQIYSHI